MTESNPMETHIWIELKSLQQRVAELEARRAEARRPVRCAASFEHKLEPERGH